MDKNIFGACARGGGGLSSFDFCKEKEKTQQFFFYQTKNSFVHFGGCLKQNFEKTVFQIFF